MKKELEFPGCILVHTISGTTHLLDGPRDLMDLMDGDCLDDACMDEGRKTLPTDPGVYSATIEYWFQQGYFEGYPAPGESDYDFRLSNLRRIDLSRIPAPAEVERLVEDLIGWAEIAGVDKYNGVENMNNSIQSMLKAKSRLLAALSSGDGNVENTMEGCRSFTKEEAEGVRKYWLDRSRTEPYQKVVPVEKLEAGRYQMMIPVEISTTGGLLLDRRDGLHGYSLEDYPNAKFFKGW